jgi:DNA-binding CsgD family transcriptional regulator
MKLPDFLQKINKEFISVNGKLFQINCQMIPFEQVDSELKSNLMDKLVDDDDALRGLELLSVPMENYLEKYVECNFGGFDQEADITNTGDLHTEFFNCGHRGNCPAEGKLCKAIQVENGYLTAREVQIVRLIGQDKMDKEIADILGFSLNTATTHRQNITRKMGGMTKAGIAAFAVSKNL